MKNLKKLKKIYLEWLETTIQLMEDYPKTSIDCGEARVREDFSNFAELKNEITFEDMFVLEREYKKLVVGSNEL